MAFDPNQAPMAIFLLIAALCNLWFVTTSYRRAFRPVSQQGSHADGGDNRNGNRSSVNVKRERIARQQLWRAIFSMAAFDVLWVWLCMIQCWNNAINGINAFNQNSGEDGIGCRIMGWYSSFSLVGMMGSHCLVAHYLLLYYRASSLSASPEAASPWREGGACGEVGLFGLSMALLLTACLFASVPLLQGDGYALTSGGYCYADFTNKAQASTILIFTLCFLLLSTRLWLQIISTSERCREYCFYYAIFFCTWILWIPAAIFGIANGTEINSPYMLVGAIVGHANAIFNPLLYGHRLVQKIESGHDSRTILESASFKQPPVDLA